MKSHTTERNVTASAGERSEFRSSNSAKIFHMLISGLYSNKPQSITREIWSNARDAHVDAGTPDRPFEVTFPSLYNPMFKVRDYGPSMDHDTVMTLYTDLGASTKEDSNDGVGKFGIGSKSPFSYTDTFSVVTYKDGIARHYSAVIEKGGTPAMYLLAEEETDQENGVEVSFPVESSDVRAFRRAATRVAHGFDIKPIVIGDDDDPFEGWEELGILSEGNGWRLLSAPLEGYSGATYAKMGCVLYPISAEALEDLSSDERQFLSSPVIIDFPIGALEITPSRETLSYGRGEPTVDAVVDRVRNIINEMGDELLSQYAACQSRWEAATLLHKHDKMAIPEVVKKFVKQHAAWNGERIETHFDLEPKLTKWVRPSLEFCVVTGDKLKNRSIRFQPGQKDRKATITQKTILIVENLDQPVKERAKRCAARIKHFLSAQTPTYDAVIWVKYFGKSRKEHNELLQLMYLLDGVDLMDANDLPEPPRALYGYSGVRSPVAVRKMGTRGYNTSQMFSEKVDISPEDMDEGGYYIKLERMEMRRSYYYNPITALDALKRAGLIDKDAVVYGVPKTLWKNFEGDEWQDFYEAAEELYADHAADDIIAEARGIADVLGDSDLRFLARDIHAKKPFDVGTLAYEAVDFFLTAAATDVSDANAMKALAQAMDKAYDETAAADMRVMLEYHTSTIKEAYPLLHYLGTRFGHYGNDLTVDTIHQYIYTCDTAAAAESLANDAASVAA